MDETESMALTWEMEILANNLTRTMEFARLRCKTRDEVLQGVLEVDSDQMDAYVYRLKELDLTTTESEFLAEGMTRLATATAMAAPSVRSHTDRLLLRLVHLLPSELAMRFAKPYFDHPRKTRRKWAYAAFRGKPLSAETATKLARVFQKTGDMDALPFVVGPLNHYGW